VPGRARRERESLPERESTSRDIGVTFQALAFEVSPSPTSLRSNPMADIPAAVVPRLQTWWTSLEGGTQAIFEAIYMDAPAVVSNVISGGQWVADGPEPGLAAQLGSGDFSNVLGENIPMAMVSDEVVVAPFHASIGQAVNLTWTEENPNQVDLPAYFTDIYVYDGDGGVVESVRLDNAPLPAGSSAQRSWQFSGAKTDGRHAASFFVNAEGSDAGSGVPGPQGYRTGAAAAWDVGGGDVAAMMQDTGAWATGINLLSGVAYQQWPDYLNTLVESVNWLASVEELEPDEQEALGKVGNRLARCDASASTAPIDSAGREEFAQTDLEAIAGAAAGNAGDFRYEGRQRVIGALVRLAP
jgi:hypothetical protein